MSDIKLVSLTIRTCVICAPAHLTMKEVIENANIKFTGENDRKFKEPDLPLIKDGDFENGKRIACSHAPDSRRHWLLEVD